MLGILQDNGLTFGNISPALPNQFYIAKIRFWDFLQVSTAAYTHAQILRGIFIDISVGQVTM